ncbi:28S ribosomal S34, mitochondrial [Olea europaea subsp. europaea]|uniref:28S ribosomal S34, mitochondrial n=2 Tax=Olea europaea subsp. europaea TaxID=158383 RepID=A0A8S0S5H3_OLEEU|nr:28S ribosomal S34, mitochondrial [Olea europaea subsp. europaea]
MAAALANKASALEITGTLFRISFKFFRNSSTTSSTASPAAASSGAKKSKRKKKNLFEVIQFLPNWGIGYHMAKIHWTGVSYQITKINLYKDGRHGKAWGIVHKDGISVADAPKKISGVHKRCWKYIPNLMKTIENSPKPETQAA